MQYNILVSPDLLNQTIKCYWEYAGISVSVPFLQCANEQLKIDFETKTGIKLNKHIGLALPDQYYNYKKGQISEVTQQLYINHNWNPVTIKWQSKSNRIYEHSDIDIDCKDIVFWFDDLDILKVHQQLYPKDNYPFKLKNLNYELHVTRITLDCTLEITVKQTSLENNQTIAGKIDDFLSNWNENSLKNLRDIGIIHNWKREITDEILTYDIDLGSTGVLFLKKILTFLSEVPEICRVEIK